MMKRSKSIEARQKQAIEEKQGLLKNSETAEALKLNPLLYRSDMIMDLHNVTVCYNGKEVFSPVSFNIASGQRIAINGDNGSGKSSILKLIAGSNISYSGTIIRSKLKEMIT